MISEQPTHIPPEQDPSEFDPGAYLAFAFDHDPDPRNWPAAERREYAAFAAEFGIEHTGGAR